MKKLGKYLQTKFSNVNLFVLYNANKFTNEKNRQIVYKQIYKWKKILQFVQIYKCIGKFAYFFFICTIQPNLQKKKKNWQIQYKQIYKCKKIGKYNTNKFTNEKKIGKYNTNKFTNEKKIGKYNTTKFSFVNLFVLYLPIFF